VSASSPPSGPARRDAEGQPYKFLDYFEEQDQDLFFGRSREIDTLVARIGRERAFVLYGRSGVGKTSLLRAGVVPVLRARGYLPVVARIGNDPVRDIARAIARETGQGEDATDLLDVARAATRDGSAPLVLLLDQLEELFIRTRKEPQKRDALIAALATLLDDAAVPLRVVFSLREDFVAELDAFRPLLPDLFERAERLLPLSVFGAREAIVKPLLRKGIRFSPRFVDALLEDLVDEGFDPPSLQIACFEVYVHARERGGAELVLDENTYVGLGRLQGIFRRYLLGLGEAIPEEERLLVAIVIDALVTRERTKRATTLRQLLGEGPSPGGGAPRFRATEAQITQALERLVTQRLVRRDDRGGELWFELSHEHVIDGALAWLDREPKFPGFRAARDLLRYAAATTSWKDEHEALLNVGQLRDVVLPFWSWLRVDRSEGELLFWSTVFRLREAAELAPLLRAVSKDLEALGAELPLDALLSATDPRLRAGAALAVPVLGAPRNEALLDLALRDADASVREASGQALGRTASDELVASLVRATRGDSARNALEALSHLERRSAVAAHLPRMLRRSAWALAERRAALRHSDAIHSRRSVGAYVGLALGLAWSLLVGLPLLALYGRLTLHIDADALPWVAGAGVLLLSGLGAAFGAIAGGAAARFAAISGRERWHRGVIRPGFAALFVPFAGLFLAMVLLAIIDATPALEGATLLGLLAALLGAGALVAVLAAMVDKLQRASAEHSPRVVFRSVCFGLLALFLLPALLPVLGSAELGGDFETMGWGTLLLFALLSIAFGAAAAGTLRGARLHPIAPAPTVPKRAPSSYFFPLAALLGLGLFAATWRPWSAPWAFDTYSVTGDGPTTLRIPGSTNAMGVRRATLVVSGDLPLVVSLRTSYASFAHLDELSTFDPWLPREDTRPLRVVLAPGGHTLVFRLEAAGALSPPSLGLELEPLPWLTADAFTAFPADTEALVLAPVSAAPDGGHAASLRVPCAAGRTLRIGSLGFIGAANASELVTVTVWLQLEGGRLSPSNTLLQGMDGGTALVTRSGPFATQSGPFERAVALDGGMEAHVLCEGDGLLAKLHTLDTLPPEVARRERPRWLGLHLIASAPPPSNPL
jgi:hypothetical protein